MINSYDLASVTATKFEKCLRDKLSQTETHYMKRQGNVRVQLESPTIRAQREREQQQQQHSYADRSTPDEVTTGRDSGKIYADEPNDAVHYLVELSDDEGNQADKEKEKEGTEEEREGQEEQEEQQEQVIEISDEDDA